jgi:patatin-like phospholipase/acyl hydrolase
VWSLTKPGNAPELKHIPRILALDGGGVRGFSSLLILERLMQEIQRLNGDDDLPLPCKYFYLICGTSTGGLIAIMLGRLRMVWPLNSLQG